MKVVTAAIAALFIGHAGLAAAETDLPPLLAPADLVAVVESAAPLILDIRAPGAADDAATYAGGHIEGAVNAPYALFRGPEENPGQVPSDAALTEVLQSLGVTADRPTVIVHQGANDTDFGAAARVYWTLKSSGVSNLAILNGGVKAWTEAGLPLDRTAVTPERSTIEVTFSNAWLATEEDVLAVVSGDARRRFSTRGPNPSGRAARPMPKPPGRGRCRNRSSSPIRTGSRAGRSSSMPPRRGSLRSPRRLYRRRRTDLLLQHRPLGGDELVRAERARGDRERAALS
jgi:thiosulfate/3-mercaptopyruvate sulfurtransferase